MDIISTALMPFLSILNPFALCLYLAGLIEDLNFVQLLRVMGGACGIAMLAFTAFALAGEPLLTHFLAVRPEALRGFGGIIFLVVGYQYAVRGYRATEMLRGSVEQLSGAIALPFMIGAGTITQSILIGKLFSPWVTIGVIALAITITLAFVLLFKLIRDHMRGARERLFDRYINILARINGLVIGAISTEMIVTSARTLWMNPAAT